MWVALLVSESRILAGETSRENLVQGQTHSSLAHLEAVADITNGSSIMASQIPSQSRTTQPCQSSNEDDSIVPDLINSHSLSLTQGENEA